MSGEGCWRLELHRGMLCWKFAGGSISGQKMEGVFVVDGRSCGGCEGVMLGGLGR